jgi:hypothetical protein
MTRRAFLAGTSALAVMALTGCGGGGGGSGGPPGTGVTIFALSGRGRRISNAAKSHNASMRFRLRELAELGRAHPGDTSKVIRLIVSRAQFDLLFANGDVADLRHL